MNDVFQEILDFWIEEIGPQGWYNPPAGLDDLIREKYGDLWAKVREEPVGQYARGAKDSLAILLLLDQFPRNMFRNQADAFASDHKALELAKISIDRGLDEKWKSPARQFYYLPLMHSETVPDQDRCLRRFLMSDPVDKNNVLHSRAHRWVIRKFGRFPYRNEALGRTSTEAEIAFIAEGGYRKAMEEVSPK